MQEQFRIIVNDILLSFKEKITNIYKMVQKISKEEDLKRKKSLNKYKWINPYTVSIALRKFFAVNELSQILDETNSLAELTHKRKLSSFGVGGLDKKKVKLEIREIHNSQYGRICPIETSEGKNAGLVLSLAKDVRVNNYGFLESPFYF